MSQTTLLHQAIAKIELSTHIQQLRSAKTCELNLQQFTHAELLAFNRAQLWDICRTNGIKCYPKSADCLEAIWNKQQSVELVAIAEVIVDSQAVAQTELETHITDQAETVAPEITTVEISFYDHEVYAQGKQIASITHDPDDFQTQRWVVMVGETEIHRAAEWAKCHSYIAWHYKQGTLPAALSVATLNTQLEDEIEPTSVIEPETYKLVYVSGVCPKKYHVYHDDSFLGIIWQHFTHWSNGIDNVQYATGIDAADLLDTKALGAPNLPNSLTVEYASPEIEIDSVKDEEFGLLYRVWNSNQLLGTFYRADSDDKWIAQPSCSSDRPRCNTDAEAQLIIVALAGLLVADSTDETVDLLDKPFDELTVADWQAIKQQAQLAELVAA